MIVFPMVGRSSRFSAAGHTLPKYMLPVLGSSLLRRIVEQFALLETDEDFLFVYLRDAFLENLIRQEAEAAGLPAGRIRLVALDEMTTGQADTVLRGLDGCGAPDDERVVIFNVDTIRLNRSLPDLTDCDGYLEVFEGEGEHWSFACVDDRAALVQGALAKVTEVAEKRRISDLCSNGLYIFRSVALFRETALAACQEMTEESGELFVAPLLQRLIEEGRPVRCGLLDAADLHFAGTPDEYDALKAQMFPKGLTPTPDFAKNYVYDLLQDGVKQDGYHNLLLFFAAYPKLAAHPAVGQAISIFLIAYSSYARFAVYSYQTRDLGPLESFYKSGVQAISPIVFRVLSSLQNEADKSFSAVNLALFAFLHYPAAFIKERDALLRRTLFFIDLPKHRLMFRAFRHKFTPEELYEHFFVLDPPFVTPSYLFALFLISRHLPEAKKRAVEDALRAHLPACANAGGIGAEHIKVLELALAAPTLKQASPTIHQSAAQDRPKAALLISGQMRDYAGLAKLVRELRGEALELDVFISTWGDRGIKPPQLYQELRGYHPAMHKAIMQTAWKYDITGADFLENYHLQGPPSEVSTAELQEAFAPKWSAIETEGQETPVFKDNQQRMFHKIASAYKAATKAGSYDVFIRARPDLHFDFTGKQIIACIERCTTEKSLAMVRRTPLYDAQAPFIDDNFCVASPAAMEIYQDAYKAFKETKFACLRDAATGAFKAHESLAYWLLLNGVGIDFLPQDTVWRYSNGELRSIAEYRRFLEALRGERVNADFVATLAEELKRIEGA